MYKWVNKNLPPKRQEMFLQKNLRSHRAGDLARAQATGAGVNLFGGTVYNSLNALDVGAPGAVRAPMRVGNLDTESNTFAAEITFSHVLHLL